MDIRARFCCCLLAIFLASVDAGGSSLREAAGTTRGDIPHESSSSSALPPMVFPGGHHSEDSEVPDLLNGNASSTHHETDTVDHPNVVDPGKTHEPGGIVPLNKTAVDTKSNQTPSSNRMDTTTTAVNVSSMTNTTAANSTEEEEEEKTNVFYTCNFSKSWLQQVRSGNISQDAWLDNDNDTNSCLFPPNLLKSNSSLHICTIYKEWLQANNYTIQNGTVSKELLADTNTTNIRCVTPKDALKDDADNNDTSHYSNSLPKAWLREGNDVYIYLVPEDVYENVTETEAEEHPLAGSNTTSPTARVKVTSDATAVKVVANATTVEGSTNKTGSTTVQVTSEAVPEPTQPVPKINTPVEEPAVVNTSDSSKNNTKKNEADNKTIQGASKPREEMTTVKQVVSSTISPKSEVENIIDHSDSSPAALLQRHADHDHSSSSGKTAFLQPTESAAILAGVFVAIALLGYVGLLVWRRFLERRYGHREMLVNEDDDFDTSDMRHFESSWL